jgi:hypothetical protein
MKIFWDRCHFCHTPINLRYTHVHPIESIIYRKHIRDTWVDYHIALTNYWYHKKLGKRWVKLCSECFHRKIKVNPHQIRQREVGAVRFQTPHPSGWTEAEFRSWLSLLNTRYNYTRRHELESAEADARRAHSEET